MLALGSLESIVEKTHKAESEAKKMKLLATQALPQAAKLRTSCDLAERAIADDLWPLPKYHEMLSANTIS